MAIRTRPIRDVIVERQIADEAAAFDLANAIGEAVEEGQSELMTKADGEVLAAQIVRQFAEFDAKAAHRQTQLYRFILLALAVAITSIVSAVT